MKVKLKYYEINNSEKPLSEISGLDLPIMMSFNIYNNMKNIEKPLEFYRKKITELVQSHCEKDEEGNPVINEDGSLMVLKSKRDELTRKCTELEHLEVEVDITKINKKNFIESINEIEPKVKLKPVTLLSIDFMFD